MKARLRFGRALIFLSGTILAMIPASASAHDGVGGDELAAAGWMLVAAIVVALLGALTMIWAFKAGQFDNIEESKYTMLETAEDFDAIMAQADAEAERLAELEKQKQLPKTKPATRTAISEAAPEPSLEPVGAERAARV